MESTKKVCRVCGQEKLEIDFYPHRLKCKQCVGKEQKNYRSQHKEQCKQYSNEYYSKNRDHILSACKEYTTNHKNERLLYWKKYYSEHKELEHSRKKRYYEDHKEEILKRERQYGKIYRARTKEQTKIYGKKYRQQNKQSILGYQRKRRKLTYVRDKELARGLARSYVPLKEKCDVCGSKKDLEHHHPDYSKPLETLTVCKNCHYKIGKGIYSITTY